MNHVDETCNGGCNRSGSLSLWSALSNLGSINTGTTTSTMNRMAGSTLEIALNSYLWMLRVAGAVEQNTWSGILRGQPSLLVRTCSEFQPQKRPLRSEFFGKISRRLARLGCLTICSHNVSSCHIFNAMESC